MKENLIIPLAKILKNKEEYPFTFYIDQTGYCLCVKSIMGIDYKKFSDIYFVIASIHNEIFGIKTLLEFQFKRLNLDNAKVVVLDEITKSEPETVYNVIQKERINGSIYIKDADSCYNAELTQENSIAVFSMENQNKLINLSDKSFVHIDDNFYVTNIIEKKIISPYFSVGGYYFSNVKDFEKYYILNKNFENLYISHIIYSMLLDGMNFRPVIVDNYIDYGTGWNQFSETSICR